MSRLDERVKNRPFTAAVVIVLICSLLGTAVGLLLAYSETRGIVEGVRASNPQDPLDMVPFLAFAIVALGFGAGMISGIFVGSVVYFANRQRSSELLSNTER